MFKVHFLGGMSLDSLFRAGLSRRETRQSSCGRAGRVLAEAARRKLVLSEEIITVQKMGSGRCLLVFRYLFRVSAEEAFTL